jgi:excisionase family DNA binding protein
MTVCTRADARVVSVPRKPYGLQRMEIGHPTENAQSTFLSAKEAAALLRISPITLGRWRIEGRGPAFRKFGRRVVYAREDLMAWAETQRRESTST